jgi:hypothetical protein
MTARVSSKNCDAGINVFVDAQLGPKGNLKGPKLEIFVAGIFTQIRPV